MSTDASGPSGNSEGPFRLREPIGRHEQRNPPTAAPPESTRPATTTIPFSQGSPSGGEYKRDTPRRRDHEHDHGIIRHDPAPPPPAVACPAGTRADRPRPAPSFRRGAGP